VYALGAVLYECLSGGPLQDAPSVQELMFRILNQAPEPVSTKRPDVPRRLESIVMRAVERDVTRRFRSAKELLMELEGLFEDSSSIDRAATTAADEPSLGIPAPRDWAKGKRSRALLLVGAAGGLASFAWLVLSPSSSMGPALATRSEPTFAASIGASSTANNDAATSEAPVAEMSSAAPPQPPESAAPPGRPDAATPPRVKARPPRPAARQAPQPVANEFVPAFDDANPYSK
jgi:serine/threonine protein kinase